MDLNLYNFDKGKKQITIDDKIKYYDIFNPEMANRLRRQEQLRQEQLRQEQLREENFIRQEQLRQERYRLMNDMPDLVDTLPRINYDDQEDDYEEPDYDAIYNANRNLVGRGIIKKIQHQKKCNYNQALKIAKYNK